MRIIRYPAKSEWQSITERPHIDAAQLAGTVTAVLDDVRLHGDEALRRYEQRFDNVSLASLAVSREEIDSATAAIPADLMQALRLAHDNITRFHQAQIFTSEKTETAPGVVCWQKSVPIERVGLYIPGGTAPLFSTVLMLAIPARIAGCREIVLCTPPDRQGNVNPAILAAAQLCGVSQVFRIGGVQAIGAMAYGTESVPRVYKIFGPGNQYVMAAKQQVALQGVAIDMPAGPSEVCVIADDTSDAAFVAADLLSQAEHGTDSQVLLITTSETMAEQVTGELEAQIEQLPRKELARRTLEHSMIVIVEDADTAMALSNEYAPEHLIIATEDYERLADRVVNAGSVFLGRYACESAGDYASGTNHTLPTHRHALAYSGVNLDSYNRKITFQHLTPEGIRSIGRAVEVMADNEHLDAHRNAMTLRIKSLDR